MDRTDVMIDRAKDLEPTQQTEQRNLGEKKKLVIPIRRLERLETTGEPRSRKSGA